MKKLFLSFLCCMLAVFSMQAQETATLSFANKAQRTSFSTEQQVWVQDGITFTNNKASSTTNVADYANPVRLYAKSEVIVEHANTMTQIVFTCNSSTYATALKNSIGDAATVSEKDVTVEPNSTSFTVSSLTAQVRVNSITVTYTKSGVTKAVAPTVVGGEFVGSKTVVITNNDDDATLYYSVNDGAFEVYGGDFVINEDTKVSAYAQIGDNEETRSVTVTAKFTRVAADPELVYDATSFDDEITVSVTSEDDVYYTLDGTKPNAESTLYEGALTLKATATLKVIAIDADGYASAVVEQKFTKNESASGAGETTLVTDASTLAVGDQIVIVASSYDYALSTTHTDNNRGQAAVTKDGNNITYGADVQIITLEEGSVDGTFAFNVGTGYLYAASSSKNYLRTETSLSANSSWLIEIADNVATIKAKGTNTKNWLRYNNSSKLFSCYSSGQADVSIYKINKASIEAYTLSVSDAGWATLCLNYDAEIPTGATCYTVSAVNGESATLAEVEGVIPANTGVIVEANEGSYTFKVATEEGSDVANELIGTTANTYITKEAYVLGFVEGKVGLYKAEMAGGVWLNNANMAYLPASALTQAQMGVAFYGFDFGGNTTAVEKVEVENEVKEIYDLQGRRIDEITKPGIYVVNGSKVLVK